MLSNHDLGHWSQAQAALYCVLNVNVARVLTGGFVCERTKRTRHESGKPVTKKKRIPLFKDPDHHFVDGSDAVLHEQQRIRRT